MILCDRASLSINLSYSLLKFLSFQGFSWSGDALPLLIHPLGAFFSSEVTLKNASGLKIPGAFWERGQVYAPFQPRERYSLDLRIEYSLPLEVLQFESDFVSIHPLAYTVALDFTMSSLPPACDTVRLQQGQSTYPIDLNNPFDLLTLPDGTTVSLCEREEFRSLIVRHQTDIPYGHAAFPSFHLAP